ncbi:aldehyde dehydrogenase family protein [Aeromicrobium sp. JJY06]|uniref:aldehyde dehydrogenase family protein n=1 Tax=Aeromicrobium sp. JJY06 TaxID=3373478 RepID=UPI00376EAA8C
MSVSHDDTSATSAPVPGVIPQLIAGEWTPGSGPAVTDENPSDLSAPLGVTHAAAPDEVSAAVESGAAALASWSATAPQERAEILRRAAEIIAGEADDLALGIAREVGKTIRDSLDEVHRASDILRYVASSALQPNGETYESFRPGETIMTSRSPVGVVSIITPFNFPLAIPAWKIGPALAYGNAVVWKPAGSVPATSRRLVAALLEAGLPPAVLNLVYGDADVGQMLVSHDDVNAVSFTGSTAVGREVIARCGAYAKPIQAGMGGVNPAIVLPDADLQDAAARVILGAFGATGQKCSSTSRLLLHSGIADRFIDELIEQVANWRVGDPLIGSTDMGPLVSGPARDRVTGVVTEALTEGANILTGDDDVDTPSRASGYFVQPTILELKDDRSPVWNTDVCGPVLSIIRVESWQEALEFANTGPYGLTASVFTHDLKVIADARRRLKVGILHVNSETTGADPHVPFGGDGDSGFGPREQGSSAKEFYTRLKTVYLRPF